LSRHEFRPPQANYPAEFLAWEEWQELRYEFDGFQPVAMTGGTVAHDRITFSLQRILDTRLAGKPCRPLGRNIKIIDDGHARYPGALVVCRPVSPIATVVEDPVIVFEILGDGTSKTDLIDKNREYRATPSIHRYVILKQTHAAAIVFVRREQDWLSKIVTGDNASLHLPEIGIDVLLADVYAGLALCDDPVEQPSG
jgi:Uma2 family endonuclease